MTTGTRKVITGVLESLNPGTKGKSSVYTLKVMREGMQYADNITVWPDNSGDLVKPGLTVGQVYSIVVETKPVPDGRGEYKNYVGLQNASEEVADSDEADPLNEEFGPPRQQKPAVQPAPPVGHLDPTSPQFTQTKQTGSEAGAPKRDEPQTRYEASMDTREKRIEANVAINQGREAATAQLLAFPVETGFEGDYELKFEELWRRWANVVSKMQQGEKHE